MSVLDKSTIKPGLLVSMKTMLEGNVSYIKTQLEEEHVIEGGAAKARWETEKTVDNAAEHEQAVKVRGRCRSLILSVCSKSNFGLLCPISKQDALAQAVSEAKSLADAFNANSELSKIGVYVLIGELVANEVEAARAINYEVRSLITAMETGIKKLDVDQVREAANRARNLGAMLSDDANEKLKEAINAARKVARAIVKEGEVAVGAIDAVTMAKLADARTAFLDLDDAAVVEAPAVEAEAPQVEFLDDDDLPPIVTMDDLNARREAEEAKDLRIEFTDGSVITIPAEDVQAQKDWQEKVAKMTELDIEDLILGNAVDGAVGPNGIKTGDTVELSGFGRTQRYQVRGVDPVAETFQFDFGPVPFSSAPMMKVVD